MADSLLWRKKGEQQFDDDGLLLALGFFEYRDHDTDNLITVYKDADLLVPHPSQIELTAAARLDDPIFLPPGLYKEALFDGDGNPVFNKDGYPGAIAVISGSGGFLPKRKTYSSNTTIPESDDGWMIDISTSGTQLSMTLPQLSTLDNGWHAWFRLTGATGSALIAAQGADTINGASSLPLLTRYEWVLVVKGASDFAAFVGAAPFGAAGRPLVAVIDRDLGTPPGAPAIAAAYIVGTGATGAWTGHENDIATWTGSSWIFLDPMQGLHVWVQDEQVDVWWNGSTYRRANPDDGTVVQCISTTYATYSSHTDAIPEDNTLPVQADEGDQIMSIDITPKAVTNLIHGHVSVPVFGATAGNKTVVSIFREAVCIAVGIAKTEAHNEVISIVFEDAPNSVSEQTYSVRVGTNGTGTTYVNGNASNRLFGGAQSAAMVLYEVAA